jgi:hypothetical protein
MARSYQSYSNMLQHNFLIGDCIWLHELFVYVGDEQGRNRLFVLMWKFKHEYGIIMCRYISHLLSSPRTIRAFIHCNWVSAWMTVRTSEVGAILAERNVKYFMLQAYKIKSPQTIATIFYTRLALLP